MQRIGTPHTPGATRVMLLGAGELGREVVIALQRLGCEVIAVDRYPAAPGQQVAHSAHTFDMTNSELLERIIREVQPTFVVPEIEALATDALGRVEADGVTEVIPNARAVAMTMDREKIRRLAAEELGLPTSPYGFASSAAELQQIADEIGYPCVIKPVMSSSGKGQSVVHSAAEIPAAWETAETAGRVGHGRVICEGFVDFDYEITQLTVRSELDGEPATWFCQPIGHRQERGDYVESWQPAAMSEAALKASRDIAGTITRALGGRGVFGVELFIRGDEAIFSEVSPRPHDTGLVTMGTQRLSEFELHARAILGLPLDVTLTSPGASAVILADAEIDAPGYTGLTHALAFPETDIRLFSKPTALPYRRMGVAIATAETIDEARQRASAAAEALAVGD